MTTATGPARATRASAPTKAPSKTQQIAETLRDDIAHGILPAGSFLPSETAIRDRFDVSRGTARNAIALLESWGLVTTAHGKGSIIRRHSGRPTHTHHRNPHIDEDAGWQPVEPATTYRTDATPDIALALGLPEGAPLFVTDRLLADRAGRRRFHRTYIPFTVVNDTPHLEHDGTLFSSPHELYAILRDHNHTLHWTEHVQAHMPTPDDTTTLTIPPGTPLLHTWRTTTNTHTKQTLLLEETRVSADDTQLCYQLGGADAP